MTASRDALPPPLPPEERTVGQLVAEAIKLYRDRFWRALATGLGPAVLVLVLAEQGRWGWFVTMWTLGALLLTASYVLAATLVVERELPPDTLLGRSPCSSGLSTGRFRRRAGGAVAPEHRRRERRLLRAYAAGLLVFVPFPALLAAFVLPGLVWLAFFGLAVPAALIEDLPVRAALRRTLTLARADYVHAFASLLTLAVLVFLAQSVLFFVLRGQGDAATRAAAFLANLVVSPIAFLGAAVLYFDQAARVGRSARPVISDGRAGEAGAP